MPDEPTSARKGGFLQFWTTLPGILTGVAAVITAVVGAIGLWRSQGGGGSISPPASANQPATAPQRAETGASQGKAPGILAQGRLSMGRVDWADLERGLIGNSANVDFAFGPESTPTLRAAADAFLAPAENQPGKQACTALLTARHDALEAIPQLDTKWICVSTTEANVAVLKIIRAPGVGNAKLVLGYTVWR